MQAGAHTALFPSVRSMNVCKNFKFLRIARDCCIRNLSGCRLSGPRISNGGTYTLEPLTKRELIRVHGTESMPFLQGLVTNDVSRLQEPNGPTSMYALFLNRGGRVMYDTIIYRTNDPDTFLLECDREASSDFRRHLRTYRVRKRIDIDTVDDEYAPWVLFNEQRNNQIATKRQRICLSRRIRVSNLWALESWHPQI